MSTTDITILAVAVSSSIKQPDTPLLPTESAFDSIDLNMLITHPGETVLV